MDQSTRQTFRSLTKSWKIVSLNDSSESRHHSDCPTSSDEDFDQVSRYSRISCKESTSDCYIKLRDSDPGAPALQEVLSNTIPDFNGIIHQSEPEAYLEHSKSVPNLHEERLKHSEEEIRQMRIRFLTLAQNRELFRQMGRNQKCTLCVICFIYFISFCTISVMEPFFFGVAVLHNISTTTYSLIFSVHPFVIFCTSPFIGHILPTIGPKFMFVCGVFIFGTCNLIFGALEYVEDNSQFVILCFIVRGMAAVGASAFSTAGATFVAHLFPGKISVVMGVLETFIGLGLSVGPVVGGVIYTLGGFHLPFFVLGATIIASLPFSVCMLPAPKQWIAQSIESPKLYKIFKNPSVCIVCMVIVTSSSAWSVLEPTLIIHMKQFDLTPVQLGLLFLLTSASYTISSPFWGWLSDKYDHGILMMIVGLSFTSLSLLLLGPSSVFALPNVLWVNMVALIMLGLFVALAYLPTYKALLQYALQLGCHTEINTYSIIAGLWASMYSLGEVIGPFLGGLLIDFYDFPMAMTSIGFTNLGVAMLLLFHQFGLCLLDRSKRRQAPLTNRLKGKQSVVVASVGGVGSRSVGSSIHDPPEELTSLLADSHAFIYGTSSCP